MGRILLLEDHERLGFLIKRGLSNSGIMVDIFGTISHAREACSHVMYDGLIVDRNLPDGDGLSWVKELRSKGDSTPCIMLTARNALHDRVDGLESGADDYVLKPFDMSELVARVRALLRRPTHVVTMNPSFADLELKIEDSQLQCRSHSIILSPTELQILLILIQKNGNVARHAALETAAWGLSESVTPNALDVSLHRIRKKMHQVGSVVKLKNIRGVGYALEVA